MARLLPTSALVATALVLTACTAQTQVPETAPPASDKQLALETLVGFLTDLHAGRYADAAAHYAGTYETMVDHNPSIDPQDRAGLMRNACTINGAQCLEVKTAGLDSQPSPTEFLFKVEFQADDGSLFVLGPCCGASETDQPSRSVFILTVVSSGTGRFQVMDMPPYAP